MPRCNFLCIYCSWVSLNFLGLWVGLSSVLENCQSSLPVFLLLYSFFLFWVSSYTNDSLFDFVSQWLDVLIPLLFKFFSLCFNLDNFCCTHIHWFFYLMCSECQWAHQNNSSFYILFFIFRITIWLLFIVFICIRNKFPISLYMLSTFSMRLLNIFIIVILNSLWWF